MSFTNNQLLEKAHHVTSMHSFQ